MMQQATNIVVVVVGVLYDVINHIRWLLQMENLPNNLIIICEFWLPTMHIPILQFN
jgi:hypothetical protein